MRSSVAWAPVRIIGTWSRMEWDGVWWDGMGGEGIR